MKLRRMFALVFCVLMATVALVGCEEAIGDYYYDYYKPNGIGEKAEIPKVNLDFYIIAEYPENYNTDAAVKAAYDSTLATVAYNINLHLEEAYKTTLNINYLTADEYAGKINEITAEGSTANKGIVLIVGKDMMDGLVDNNSLIELGGYLTGKEYKFGTLNVQISAGLLDMAKTEVDGEKKLFCIPNNHVIDMDAYDYIAINREVALSLHFSENEMKQMTSLDCDLVLQLQQKAADMGIAAPVVKAFTDVNYGYTSPYAEDWVYNVMSVPTVSKEEAYSTAYGILAGTPEADRDRAMEIIYALNTDVTFRNMLQYGVLNNHYAYVDGSQMDKISQDSVYIAIKSGSLYKMNIEYTGDVFKAYYTADWTEQDAVNGKIQNSEALYN